MFYQVEFTVEPTGREYVGLIKVATGYCSSFLLIERHEISLGQSAKNIISDLDRFILNEAEASEWPGTRLVGHSALVREYKLNDDSAQVLANAALSLYSWQQPELLEDLCFLRFNRRPWLISIAHENDGYLYLEPEEERFFRARGMHIRRTGVTLPDG